MKRRYVFSFILVGSLLCNIDLGLWAATFTVGVGGTHGTIQAAIDAAVAAGGSNTIRVRRVAFNENLIIPATFIGGNLSISGGWNSTFTGRTEDPTVTVVDGGAAAPVIEILANGGTLVIEGFTFQNGRGDFGAGIRIVPHNNAKITIRNNHVINNSAVSSINASGAGVVFSGGDAVEISILDNRIAGNTANSTGGSTTVGAGLYLEAFENATFAVIGNVIENNQTVNTANQSTGVGSYLTTFGNASGQFSENIVRFNSAGGSGGVQAGSGSVIWINGSGTVTARQNQWLENANHLSSGGSEQLSLISAGTTTLIVSDSLVAAGNQSGIFAEARNSSTLHMTNLTIADHAGAGIAFGGSGTRSFYNSIVFNNSFPSSLPDVDMGSNLIGIDPLFVDSGSRDYTLLPGSAAVDQGDMNPPGGLGNGDAAGNPRVLGASVDIGAFELDADQITFYFPQVGDGRTGTIRFQTALNFTNTTDLTGGVTVAFFDSDGVPMELSLGGSPAGSVFSFRLDGGESISLETGGASGLRVGYATVTAGPGVGGTAVFIRTHTPTGTVLYEAGVPASGTMTNFTIIVDSTQDRNTGLAVVNPVTDGMGPLAAGDATLTLRLYDQSFSLIRTETMVLPAGHHRARFVHELFSAVAALALEMEGVVTVQSDRPVTAVTLRQNDGPNDFPDEVPTLTVFPVLPGRAD